MTGFGYNINGFGGGLGKNAAELETQSLINGQSNYNTVIASQFVGNGGTLIIPVDFWVFSTGFALTVDVNNLTIENYGKIVGKVRGISISGSGCVINNYSGAFIAGGGGNGAQGRNGQAGKGAGSSNPLIYLNQAGPSGNSGFGGGAGGGAASVSHAGGLTGGQGGWILPGSGGAAGSIYSGAGGSGGNVGGNGTHYGNDGAGPLNGSGGGGGWGAYGGGNGLSGSVGAVGSAAIHPLSNPYTLNNSGIIYGST